MFDAVFQQGKRTRSQSLSLRYLLAPENDSSRMGFVLRKKLGPAPLRNRVRRILRAEFQKMIPSLPNLWLVLDPGPQALRTSPSELGREAAALLKRMAVTC